MIYAFSQYVNYIPINKTQCRKMRKKLVYNTEKIMF